MHRKFLGIFVIIFTVLYGVGCSSNQTVKDTWKESRNLWYTYVSYPATIDYDDVGEKSKYEDALAQSMLGIDVQLTDLKKVMSNADKPPTNEWVSMLFARFPWLSGFSGIKADGSIIGQVPGTPMKPLDFSPLLLEDKQQNFRALRGYVQDTPMGPEVFLATPLYDAHVFLGVVTVYFDMRALLQYSSNADNLVILSPQALLWAGKYDFAQTPMAGVQWDQVVLKGSSGTVSNVNGSFYWTMIYFANQPLIFAVPIEGNFGEQTHELTGPTTNGSFVSTTPMKLEESTTAAHTDADGASTALGSGSAPSIFTPAEEQEKASATQPVADVPIYKAEPPRRAPVYTPPQTPITPPRAFTPPSPIHAAPSPIYDAPRDDEDAASSEDTVDTQSTDTSAPSEANTKDAEEETAKPDAAESGNAAPQTYRPPSPFGPQ